MFLNAVSGWRVAFRGWRRSRPFWAGVWTLLAGLEILSIPLAPVSLMVHEGIAGVSGLLMGIFLAVLALTLWLAPGHRVFAGIATLVFAVASLVLSNFGGFLIGFLLGALGGAMAVSWTPDGPPPRARTAQPGLDWPRLDPDGTGGGGIGDGSSGTGEDSGGPGGAPLRAGRSDRSPGPPRTGNRLRALGTLPAGGALLAGLQPLSPATAHAGLTTRPPTTPADPGVPLGGGQLTVCSLLDALLATAGPTVHVNGHGGPLVRIGPTLPAHRAVSAKPVPEPLPQPTRGGGLLGAVTGLLGLNGALSGGSSGSEAGSERLGRGPVAGSEAGRAPSAATPSAMPRAKPSSATPPTRPPTTPPAVPPAAPPRPGVAAGNAVSPSLLRLVIPVLPADHGMDDVMSLLPLSLRLGAAAAGSGGRSPWCLPEVSLGLSPGAARYGAGAVAAQPFRVRTPLLVLTGLTYHGITTVPTRSGPRRVLAFTAFRVDIAALRQTTALLAPGCGPEPGGFPHFRGVPGIRLPLLDMGLPGLGHLDPGAPPPWASCQGEMESDGAPDGTTTAAGGPVVLLTSALSGDLLGLLPVTFTPDMPPPLPPGLTVPLPLFFTDATSYDQFLSADELSVPGLHQTAS